MTDKWRDRLAVTSDRLNVGLVWAGNPDHRKDAERSIPLGAFAPLFETAGVRFFNLQKSAVGRQAGGTTHELLPLSSELEDFADTAALISLLDLVITVDTSVAHLAGALGRAVWVMLPFTPDWRWLLGREDSPWYPTMRLFRQSDRGDWESVIRQVASAVHKMRQLKHDSGNKIHQYEPGRRDRSV